MIKIFHLYGNKVNLGDWGSVLGVRQLLESVTNEKIQYTDWHVSYEPSKIDDTLILKINREYDALIIGGGGLLFKKESKLFTDNWPLGILIPISRKNLESIKIPIFIFSIGLNQNMNETKKFLQKNYGGIYFNKKQVDNIRFLYEISTLASARDNETINFLKRIGCSKNVYLTPCPSMFLCQDSEKNPRDESNKTYIGINVRGDIPPTAKTKILQIAKMIQEMGFNITLLSHNSKQGEGLEEFERLLGLKTIISESPMQLMDNYWKLDFSIGMRGHSNIFSFGAVRPFVSLSYNFKNNFFAEMVDMKDYLLSLYKEWSADEFMDIFFKMIEHKVTIKNNFRRLKKEFYKMDKEFARKIIQNI